MGCSRECFDWASAFYDYSRAIPNNLMKKTIETLQEKVIILSDATILEVGVGTGRIAIPLTEKLNVNTIGIDISEKMIHKCQEKISSTSNIQLIVADGLTLPFVINRFDIIFTCHVLHLLPNAYQFLENMVPLLIKNGYYINLEAYVNYHRTVPFEIYYNKLSEVGFRYRYKGDLVRRGIIIYLSRRGWKHQQCVIKGEREISINNLVRFIRNRVFSHQRTIADDLHKQALQHLYIELEERNIELSAKVLAPAASRLNIFNRKKKGGKSC
ncbi:MAG: class I SAM-dependent methyltransferase [Candidatus Hodarchaeota archaeon]